MIWLKGTSTNASLKSIKDWKCIHTTQIFSFSRHIFIEPNNSMKQPLSIWNLQLVLSKINPLKTNFALRLHSLITKWEYSYSNKQSSMKLLLCLLKDYHLNQKILDFIPIEEIVKEHSISILRLFKTIYKLIKIKRIIINWILGFHPFIAFEEYLSLIPKTMI